MTETLVDAARQRPLVFAHRGASRQAPENTLDAFQAAIGLGCDAVEFDVRRTADGVLVVHHAAARRGRPLAQLTYAELEHRSRHHPPRLDEVIEVCAGRIGMDVELKEAGYEAAVLAALAQRFPLDKLLITSFHDAVIAAVKGLNPLVSCGLLLSPSALQGRGRVPAGGVLVRAERCGADVLLPHQLLVPPGGRRIRPRRLDILAAAGEQGLAVIAWTVNAPRRMRRYLADPRIAGIITDLPDLAHSVLYGLPRHSSQPSI